MKNVSGIISCFRYGWYRWCLLKLSSQLKESCQRMRAGGVVVIGAGSEKRLIEQEDLP